MPKVSVVVPNYNHASHLRARLDSIAAQTFGDWELLFLDDASSDDSAAVFATWCDSDAGSAVAGRLLSPLFSPTNSGSAFAQWDRGVRASGGEYVWIAEADDLAEPTLLVRLVAALDAHPRAGLAYCQSRLIDGAGRSLGTALDKHRVDFKIGAARWERDFVNDGRDECARFLVRRNTIPNASAVLFRRSAYEAVGGASTSMRVAGDLRLWASILLYSDVAFVAEPLNLFRQHAGSARRHSALDGSALEEECANLAWLLGELGAAVPASLRAAALDEIADRWVELLRHAAVAAREGDGGATAVAPTPERLTRIAELRRVMDPGAGPRLWRRTAWRAARRAAARLTGRARAARAGGKGAP